MTLPFIDRYKSDGSLDAIRAEASIAANIAHYEKAAAGAFSDSTVRAIRADLKVLTSWADASDLPVTLPLQPEIVAAFIDAMSESKAPATVRRYVASLNHLHRAAGTPCPGSFETVRLAIRRMNRANGTRQQQAAPLRRVDVDRILQAIPDTRTGLRDRALIATAYDTLARRSEIAAMNLADLERAGDGTGTILIRRSKADQEGQGALTFIACDTLAMIDAWTDARDDQEAPLFTNTGPAAKSPRMAGGDIARMFKRRASAVGIDAARISGHSTRVGCSQDMRAAGLDNGAIMQAGRWKSERMVARYTEALGARSGGAARLAEIQGR
jgi:integrase